MTHPLVLQLRFPRSEFKRALDGLSDEDARRRFVPMNCLSWAVGHMAAQEQRYWFTPDRFPRPDIHKQFAYGAPAVPPDLDSVWQAWHTIIAGCDPWLDTLTTEELSAPRTTPSRKEPFTFGSLMQRAIYHYWYHTGEAMAVRQILGHTDLPEFVGNIDDEAPYLPE